MKFIFLFFLIILMPYSYAIGFGLSPNKVIIKENWTMFQNKIVVFNPSNQSLRIHVNYDKSKFVVVAPQIIKPNSLNYINYTIISESPFASSFEISAMFSTIRLIQNVEFKAGLVEKIKKEKQKFIHGIILIIAIILIGSFVFKKISFN